MRRRAALSLRPTPLFPLAQTRRTSSLPRDTSPEALLCKHCWSRAAGPERARGGGGGGQLLLAPGRGRADAGQAAGVGRLCPCLRRARRARLSSLTSSISGRSDWGQHANRKDCYCPRPPSRARYLGSNSLARARCFQSLGLAVPKDRLACGRRTMQRSSRAQCAAASLLLLCLFSGSAWGDATPDAPSLAEGIPASCNATLLQVTARGTRPLAGFWQLADRAQACPVTPHPPPPAQSTALQPKLQACARQLRRPGGSKTCPLPCKRMVKAVRAPSCWRCCRGGKLPAARSRAWGPACLRRW